MLKIRAVSKLVRSRLSTISVIERFDRLPIPAQESIRDKTQRRAVNVAAPAMDSASRNAHRGIDAAFVNSKAA